MKKQLFFFSTILCLSAVFGQNSKITEKADKQFKRFDYLNAIDNYNKADSLTDESLRKLGESYKKTNQMEKAEEVYQKLTANVIKTKEDIYNYTYVLKENKKYDEANKWMQLYQTQVTKELRVIHFLEGATKLPNLSSDNGQFMIHNLDINTSEEDFGTSFYGDKVVFATSTPGNKIIKRSWAGNHKGFLDMYLADNKGSQLEKPLPFGKLMNKKYHEGPASFAKDNNFMAFTTNNYLGKSNDGTIKLQIFFSEKKDGSWSKPLKFILNNDNYSVGHPYLTQDGNTMYFASDMPGGLGGVDLYKVIRQNDGEWSQAINLGNKINTEGNEMFPFLLESTKIFFFASDGQFGLGGLDIFAAPYDNNTFSQIKNLGVPVNSSHDDFAFIVDQAVKSGFFSSNRLDGKGDDDIYSFEVNKPFVFGKRLIGVASDKLSNALPLTKVYLFDDNKTVIDSTITNDKGEYAFVVEPGKNFALKGEKTKYFPGKNTASSDTPEETIVADLALEKDPGLSLFMLVTDKQTSDKIKDVILTITNVTTGKVEVLNLGDESQFLKPLLENKINDNLNYKIKLEAPGYLSKTMNYTQLLDKEGQYNVHKSLDLGLSKIIAGQTKLEDLIAIKPIYFDLNKDFIRKDAAIELDKIVQVMNENPTMVVELGSHTDCRATFKYNENLSDRRAKSSAKYIAAKITGPTRIYGKGYGEAILLNGCACEGTVKSTCTEEEHQLNRRTEFKIIKFDSPNTKIINTSPDSFGK
jgi:outer membrane protein OmpA-like peptidoglycan-associated protein/tetratricopeptide (TPR) repeat protein